MKKIKVIFLIIAILLIIGMLLIDFLYPDIEIQPIFYLPVIIIIWLLLRGQAKKMDERRHRKEDESEV